MLIRIGQRSFPAEHLDKLYFPEDGITKRMLMQYYEGIAYFLLPPIKNRPLMMHRFPLGIHEQNFYQKEVPDYFPSWIATQDIKKKTQPGSTRTLLCNNTATLVYLATQGCITLHRWLSTCSSLNYPDCMIFDIDPPHHLPVDFQLIGDIARTTKAILFDNKLSSYVMTTGSRGVHVMVPLAPHASFAQVRTSARAIAEQVVHQHPHDATLSSSKKHRGNKILIDIMRNSYGATAVAPYALRALPTAPVATPIDWSELNTSVHSAQAYTLRTIGERLQKVGDVWQDMHHTHHKLPSISHGRKTSLTY